MLVTRGSGKYKAAAVHVKIKCPRERGRNLSLSEWLCHQKEHQSHCSQACYNFLFFYTLDNNLGDEHSTKTLEKACEKGL